jgi:hypothetical protein
LIDWLARNPLVVAAIFTALGAILLRVTEKVLGAKAERQSEVKDYRDNIKELQERLDKVEEEVTLWRNRYYASQVDITRLTQALIKAGIDVPPSDPR